MTRLSKIVEKYKKDKVSLLWDIMILGCIIKVFIIFAFE